MKKKKKKTWDVFYFIFLKWGILRRDNPRPTTLALRYSFDGCMLAYANVLTNNNIKLNNLRKCF